MIAKENMRNEYTGTEPVTLIFLTIKYVKTAPKNINQKIFRPHHILKFIALPLYKKIIFSIYYLTLFPWGMKHC